MENEEGFGQGEPKIQLIVTEEMRSHFYEIAKWASFLAVVGFVITGFMVIAALTVGPAMNSNPEIRAMIGKMGSLGSIGFTVICMIYAFVIFYPSLLLFKYSTKAKLGILYGEQSSLDEAISKLKSLFKYWGILTFIFIGLYVLMLFSSVLTQVK